MKNLRSGDIIVLRLVMQTSTAFVSLLEKLELESVKPLERGQKTSAP